MALVFHKVLTFGSGDCGQLAHGVEDDADMMVKYPRVVRSLQNKSIIRVSCGGIHSAAVTTEGEVFTWGCNDDGALGRGGEENFPAKVEGFGNNSIVQVLFCLYFDLFFVCMFSLTLMSPVCRWWLAIAIRPS